MTKQKRSPITSVKIQQGNNGSQTQLHLTVRELWNDLYSLIMRGHGDDQIGLYVNGQRAEENPILLGVLRADHSTEVWISDTKDVL